VRLRGLLQDSDAEAAGRAVAAGRRVTHPTAARLTGAFARYRLVFRVCRDRQSGAMVFPPDAGVGVTK
jgi:hypothetical protein